MQTTKASQKAAVTPSQKKLKQARLPFKLISDVSPKPSSPPSRKRKLSVPDVEPSPKIGKLSKENDRSEELVVISDDESKDSHLLTNVPKKEEKLMNPYVKLVDAVLKKKQQKKTPKKKDKNRSSKNTTNESAENNNLEKKNEEIANVDVEKKIENESTETNDMKKQSDGTADDLEKMIKDETAENSNLEKLTIDMANGELEKEMTNESRENNNMKKQSDEAASGEVGSSDVEMVDVDSPVTPTPETPISTGRQLGDKSIEVPITPNTPRVTHLPQRERRRFTTGSTSPTSPVVEGQKNVKTTPKLESAKKKEEREREKQEREKKKQQEKEERAKLKQEKEEQRKREREEKEEQKKREREEKEEQKRREREEKEEQKRKEREEKEKQKEMEKKLKEMKEEQKRKEKEDKEEQRRKEKEAKEEERRKKQEAVELEKQEQELKKKKAAEAFVSFFVPKQKVEKDQTMGPVSKNNMLSSFTIKADMRLAPTCRVDLSDEKREILDMALEEQNLSQGHLYLNSLREGTVKPMSNGKTWPLSDKDDDDDVMIIEDELPPMDSTGEIVTCEPAPREKLRPKLFSFHENRRPPYWGTWRKKSSFIKPRKPFGQDEKQLDYEVDSDEEWEEEQEGESLDGSACGSDDEGDARDEYEVDNEVFVPHGYLSDEEATMEDDVLSLSPETQKARLKHLEDEFESEMKKPTEKLKPRLYGLLWENNEGGKPENCVDALWNYFAKFSMILNDPTPLFQPTKEPEEAEKKKIKKKKVAAEGEEQSPKREKKKKQNTENKECKKVEIKKIVPNQPGINTFLTKIKTT